jgi:hypothetical protein
MALEKHTRPDESAAECCAQAQMTSYARTEAERFKSSSDWQDALYEFLKRCIPCQRK